jgi:hypothetical protein
VAVVPESVFFWVRVLRNYTDYTNSGSGTNQETQRGEGGTKKLEGEGRETGEVWPPCTFFLRAGGEIEKD